MITVTPKQLKTILAAAIPARHNILITGAPGIGKTDILTQSAMAAGADLIISHPVVADPTDAKGLPWAETGATQATFLPFGELADAINATRNTVWFLDDLGQASPAVQASFMQLLLARRVNGHCLPECVTFVAATNRRTDRAGVSGILEPVKSRFTSILELEPTIDDWSQWAIDAGLNPILIAFLRYRPELLCAFTATADLTNSPMPRTWSAAAKVEALALPAALELAAMAGAVGESAATEYLAFRKMFHSLGNIDAIFLNPSTAPIPSQPSELYAITAGLAARVKETTFPALVTYGNRLIDSTRGEFAVLMIKDATRRNEKLQYTDTFVRLMSGPFGALYTGGE